LKPGQQQVDRHVYKEEAKPHEETYVGADVQNGSVYMRSMADVRIPGEYDPPRRHRTLKIPEDFGRSGASKWQTESRAAFTLDAVEGQTYARQRRAPYDAPWLPQPSTGYAACSSTYTEDFGTRGSNPRDLVNPDHIAIPVSRNSLSFGTTKGTGHIPGYQGFLSSRPDLPGSAVQGEHPRAEDRINHAQIFHRNLVGYAGHQPEDAQNDRGPRRRSDRTTMDCDFVSHSLDTFA